MLPALIGRGGLIISDELNHSSIVTGARGSAARIKVRVLSLYPARTQVRVLSLYPAAAATDTMTTKT